jgi:small subunit ribosomal protein S16
MLIIRLIRVGKKKDPSFRVVVVDSKKKPKTGSYLEMVGSYNPQVDRVELKADRIREWMENGAQVSDTVHNLLVSQKIIDAKKINVLPKKTYTKPEVAVAEKPITTEASVATESDEEVKSDNPVAEAVITE